MPARKGWIDKKTASHYTLVHRPQNDPLIHDAEAPPVVFASTTVPNKNKIKTRRDLESEYHYGGSQSIRENEGEAAEHGIYYDDSDYDYMQHLRDLGDGGGVYLEAEESIDKQSKGKGRMKLEDALAEVSLEERDDLSVSDVFDGSSTASSHQRKVTYQDQQDVPDVIAGFQPDMDPRLREVLEALEDEAYVDDSDDIFNELSKDRNEVPLEEFEDSTFDFQDLDGEDDGWESDHTAKPDVEYEERPKETDETDTAAEPNPAWLAEFSKFKKDTTVSQGKKPKATLPTNPRTPSLNQSIQSSLYGVDGLKKKKRKGAKTNSSNYSMTSSSLARTEGLTLLDSRFDKIEEEYADEGYGEDMNDLESSIAAPSSVISGVSSRASSNFNPSGEVRADFDSVMDEFLGGYSMNGKRRVKRGGPQSGLQQLDEVRKGLGPARVAKTAKT